MSAVGQKLAVGGKWLSDFEQSLRGQLNGISANSKQEPGLRIVYPSKDIVLQARFSRGMVEVD